MRTETERAAPTGKPADTALGNPILLCEEADVKAVEAEVKLLRMLAEQTREFALNVVNRAADFKTGPHQIEGDLWDFICWLCEYATEQVGACDAIGSATGDWKPTAAAINALPGPLRQHIHDLETRCDPAGEVAELTLTRDQNQMLQAQVTALTGGLDMVYAALEKPAAATVTACGTVCEAVRLQVCADCECPWKALADCSQWDGCLARTVAEGACEGCEEVRHDAV